MKKMSKILCLLLVFALICIACKTPSSTDNTEQSGATAIPAETEPPAADEKELVLNDPTLLSGNTVRDNNRVFYEIFVCSFSDSNGDGIGDLRGIINRMDYLNDGDPNSGKSLGVEGLWLSPIFKSPSYF